MRVRGLSFRRRDKVIFDGLDLDVGRGHVTALLGPSGTGKTTLLRAIVGQVRTDAGRVEVFGDDVASLRGAGLRAMRQRIGYLYQQGALFTDLTAFDNVAFPLREQAGLPESVVRDLVLLKLEAVGLRGAADQYPRELSGGMKHRLALARAVALDPELLLYDEPFSGQDPISIGVLIQLIRSLNDATDTTSIVVTHDVDEAMRLADRLVFMFGGKVAASGTAGEIRANPLPALQQFLLGEPDGPVPFHQPTRETVDQALMRSVG